MGREVVHYVVERLGVGVRKSRRMAPEHRHEGIGFVIGLTLEVHLSVGVIEEGQHIHRPVTDILELLKAFSHPVGLYIRREPLQDLDAGALIEEEQVTWRTAV